MAMLHDITDPASLLGKAARTFTRPDETFDPMADREAVYDDLSSFNLRPQGELRLRRQTSANGTRLTIGNSRICPSEHRYYVDALLQCSDDDLCSPTSWVVTSKVARSPDGPARLNSGMRKQATIRGRELIITTGEQILRRGIEAPATCKWCLLEAVQRIDIAVGEPLPFALIDEYDQLFPGQVLLRRPDVTVPLGGHTETLRGYQLTGRGTVPATYWVRQDGRLLFYLAGMQFLRLRVAAGGSR